MGIAALDRANYTLPDFKGLSAINAGWTGFRELYDLAVHIPSYPTPKRLDGPID